VLATRNTAALHVGDAAFVTVDNIVVQMFGACQTPLLQRF
jgi:Fe-S cluster biogenesis protein NfuA